MCASELAQFMRTLFTALRMATNVIDGDEPPRGHNQQGHTDVPSKQQEGRRLDLQSACSAHGEVCDNLMSALKLLANLQEEENFIDVVYDGTKEGGRRKMEAALRQFIEIDNH